VQLEWIRTIGFLCIVFLLCVVPVADASVTVSGRTAILNTASYTIDAEITNTSSTSNLFVDNASGFADLTRKFLRPPVCTAAAGGDKVNHVKSFPAVPTALLMVLTGFLSITFVRDRKLWLAAIAMVLCLGSACLNAVPHLALSLSGRVSARWQFATGLSHSYQSGSLLRTRSDIEGTGYIGLLHKLAGIPGCENLSDLFPQSSKTGITGQIANKFCPPQFAVVRFLSNTVPLTDCPANMTGQIDCFSPAFTFAHIPRGPPVLS
jgi:hypothetical protein